MIAGAVTVLVSLFVPGRIFEQINHWMTRANIVRVVGLVASVGSLLAIQSAISEISTLLQLNPLSRRGLGLVATGLGCVIVLVAALLFQDPRGGRRSAFDAHSSPESSD